MRESKRRNSKYFPIHTLPSSHLPKTHGLYPSGDSQMLGSCGNACLIPTSSQSPTALWDGDSMTEDVMEKEGKHAQLSEAEKSNNKSQIFTMRAKRVGAQSLWACAGGWGFSLALPLTVSVDTTTELFCISEASAVLTNLWDKVCAFHEHVCCTVKVHQVCDSSPSL